MSKTICEMTKTEFNQVKNREYFDTDIGEFDSLVLIPKRGSHDSGFRLMNFVAVKNNIPVCRLSGCSDVLHIDGICGVGKWRRTIPRQVSPKGWSIDCLKKSGLFRLFPRHGYGLKCGVAISSFEIYAVKRNPREEKE